MRSHMLTFASAILLCLACLAHQLPAGESKAWQPDPAAADAPLESARVRIVDFGADFLRGGGASLLWFIQRRCGLLS